MKVDVHIQNIIPDTRVVGPQHPLDVEFCLRKTLDLPVCPTVDDDVSIPDMEGFTARIRPRLRVETRIIGEYWVTIHLNCRYLVKPEKTGPLRDHLLEKGWSPCE